MSSLIPAEPLLSEEEAGALLDAMREGDRYPSAASAAETDLVDPERALRGRLDDADAAGGPIAQALRAQLLKLIARGTDVLPEPAEIVPREVLLSTLDPHGLCYRLGGDAGILSFSAPLVRYVVGRCMGAPEESLRAPAAAPPRFTELDRRVFASLPVAVAAQLEGLLGTRPEVSPSAEDLRGPRPFEPMLRLSFELSASHRELGHVVLAIAPQALGCKPAPKREPGAHGLRDRLGLAEVELSALLGIAPTTVRELLALNVGDVLRLDACPLDPLPVLVEDVVLARGLPIVRSGNLAIEITERNSA